MATGTEPPATDPHPRGGVHTPTRAAIRAPHLRTDRWWLAPAATAAGLLAFVVYSTWRAFANADYYAAPYVSPFYSPCLAENCEPMRSGPNWELLGTWWGVSPAIIILIFPLGFRLTCYYYRKAYYRGFWASPPACAVAEPHKKYTGETRFPLILQNVHRYFFYAALLVAGILTYDTVLAFRDEDYAWGHMGLGTLVFLANIALIEDAQVDAAAAEALRPFSAEAHEPDAGPPENPYTLHQELQQTMNDLVGIIRREAEMKQALEKLAELRVRARRAGVEGHRQFNPGWHLALDLRNMLLVSECVARAALERTESRGGHTREDHPSMDRRWRPVNLLCSLAGPADELAATDPERGRIALERQTTEPIRPDLLALFDKEELVKYLADEELEGLSE
ncbi:hypothetical protein STENM36S_01778 [Streptomyces tendae]